MHHVKQLLKILRAIDHGEPTLLKVATRAGVSHVTAKRAMQHLRALGVQIHRTPLAHSQQRREIIAWGIFDPLKVKAYWKDLK